SILESEGHKFPLEEELILKATASTNSNISSVCGSSKNDGLWEDNCRKDYVASA
ncbi:hypothetical protein A2U01_0020343, partial [Trifolium medium]|nr:hypothetical protein [Trifolium medium]